jgi:catecholate siderophore receptor
MPSNPDRIYRDCHIDQPFAATMHRLIALAAICAAAATPCAATASTVAPLQQRRDSTARDSTPQALKRVLVAGRATRSAGYASPRTTTATKTDTPLRDTPQAVTVVTRKLMADQAMQGMADVVRYIPGVTMGQGEGHRDAPTIRGNSSTADFFIDGVRDDAQYFRDLYNVERVEALKGSNAMIFGRGGGGGVINRVSKEAEFAPIRSLALEGGSFDHKRGSIDVGQPLAPNVAARFNGMYEHSGGFRDAASLERSGVNPTLTVAAGANTTVRLGYEYFRDHRTVDRGQPSFQGRPSPAPVATFFGNPDLSYADARVHGAGMTIDHTTAGGVTLRNRSRFMHYDKLYQNVFPGAVNAAGTTVSLSAYNNAHARTNLFNQTDATYGLTTGPVRHTVLLGVEVGRQATDNFRQTGYFNDQTTSSTAPFATPTVSTPVTFRQSASDADNRVVATVGALYAQNQVVLSSRWQAIAGLRYERFDVRYRNDRDGTELGRDDHMVSPRVGLVYKPFESLSAYGGYGVSYLPSAGDQFSSLTATSETLEPERFANYEIGAKWDVRPGIAITTAAYRLDRSNTTARDPNDPARTVQTGEQRTTGYEIGVTGDVTPRWQLAGGFASQRARVVSATTSAREGATVPLVPHTTVSLWNRYQVATRLGGGIGVVHQTRSYAAIDNAVTLPGFTRVDAAAYVGLTRGVTLQANVENVLGRRYYPTSHGNNNILPGAPRTLRVGVNTGF